MTDLPVETAASNPNLSIPKPSIRPAVAEAIFALACVVLGAWIVVAATGVYGAGVSSDSMVYIAAADHLARGLGVFDYSGAPVVEFPPLYPLALAVLSRLSGVTPFVVGRFLNAAATAGVILSMALVLRRSFPGRRIWPYLGTLATVALASFYTLASVIATDTLYILLSLWFALVGQAYLRTRKPAWLIALTVLACAAALLRWVGLALVVVEFVLVWAAWWDDNRRAAVLSLLASGVAALPVVLWVVVRNRLIYGWAGRSGAKVDVLGNLELAVQRMAAWTSPHPVRDVLPLLVVLLAAALALNLRGAGRQRWAIWLRRLAGLDFLPVLLPAAVYFGAVLVTEYTLDHLQPFDDRYQLPLFAAILVVLFSAFDDLIWSHLSRPLRVAADLAVVAVFAWWGAYQFGLVRQFIDHSRAQGVAAYNDYNTRQFVRSGLVVQLIQHPPEPGVTLYSNQAEAVYFFLHRVTLESPTDQQHYRADPRELLPRYAGWPGLKQAYLIWFKPNPKRQYYPPSELKKLVIMKKLYKSWDGELYLIRPK